MNVLQPNRSTLPISALERLRHIPHPRHRQSCTSSTPTSGGNSGGTADVIACRHPTRPGVTHPPCLFGCHQNVGNLVPRSPLRPQKVLRTTGNQRTTYCLLCYLSQTTQNIRPRCKEGDKPLDTSLITTVCVGETWSIQPQLATGVRFALGTPGKLVTRA